MILDGCILLPSQSTAGLFAITGLCALLKETKS
jgi:hypothetical protein